MGMVWRVVRYAGGVVLIPVAGAAFVTLLDVADQPFGGEGSNMKLFLAIGAGAYIAAFIIFYKYLGEGGFLRGPLQFLWKLVLGRRPEDEAQEVRGLAGIISLLPYAFPIYTFVGMAAVVAVNHIHPFDWSGELLALVIGLTYMQHVFFVAQDLRKRRAGVASGGFFFSMMVVIILNLEVVAALFAILSVRLGLFVDFNKGFYALSVDWLTFFKEKADEVEIK